MRVTDMLWKCLYVYYTYTDMLWNMPKLCLHWQILYGFLGRLYVIILIILQIYVVPGWNLWAYWTYKKQANTRLNYKLVKVHSQSIWNKTLITPECRWQCRPAHVIMALFNTHRQK